MFTARYGLSPYVLKGQVLSLKNLPGRGLTKAEKHCSTFPAGFALRIDVFDVKSFNF